MIRINQLGRLGGSLLDDTLSFDPNAPASATGQGSSGAAAGGASSFVPSTDVLDHLSLTGSETTVIANQTSVETPDTNDSSGALFDALAKGATVVKQALTQPALPPATPVEQSLSGGAIAAVALGALALLGIGYVALTD